MKRNLKVIGVLFALLVSSLIIIWSKRSLDDKTAAISKTTSQNQLSDPAQASTATPHPSQKSTLSVTPVLNETQFLKK